MKKALLRPAAVVAVLCVLFGCARTQTPEYPLTVNGTPLDGEIFYYLDIAFADAALPDKDARVNYATEQCIRYVAVNSAFTQRGLSLAPAETASVTETADALWAVFGAHYEKIGVSKQTFVKLRTSMFYAERLRYALFDADGVSPIPDDTLKAYFAACYAAFKVLRGHLYGADVYGNRVELTAEELAAVREKYETAAGQINKGTAIDYTYASLISSGNEEVQQSLTTEVIAAGDPAYPEGFYEAVRGLPENAAGVLEFGDDIFLVFRVGILEDTDLFQAYRDECLLAVSEPYLQSEINAMCNGYSSIRKTGAVQRCYEEVKEGRK